MKRILVRAWTRNQFWVSNPESIAKFETLASGSNITGYAPTILKREEQ